ncbi:MAG: hypothetical protein Q7T86_12440 [Hyphomicrobiaceae bacterium]|nr:hypothetical protein [Hyphomicrobiaceae bacterium]
MVAREERSQHRNKAIVLERLAALLKLAQSLAELTKRHTIQENHDRVERGRPIRRFKG